jgi:RNA polymerase sigma factor (sigma-70 family)
MQTEKQLIEGCCKQDRQCQELLYKRFSSKMLVTCLRYTKGRQEAEDVLQEGFIKVFNKIGTFRGESSLEHWVRRIMVRTALNFQRSKLYLYPMVDVDHLGEVEQSPIGIETLGWQDLLKMIQSLPTGCQVIFNLFAIEGYQHKEIAEMLEINEGTSKSQYARARKLLKEMILQSDSIQYEEKGK